LTQQNMAQAGETDIVSPVYPGKQAADYKKISWDVSANPDVNEVWVPDSAHSDSPWSNQKVREAAEYSVDRATIAEKFGYGYLQAPNQIPPRSTTAYDPNSAVARGYNPEKAKQLLAEAGYPNGFKTKLIAWPGANKDMVIAEQQYLSAVGIQAEVEFADMGKLTTYLGPTGTWHNAILEMACPAQGPTGVGILTFTVGTFGENWQKPAELTQAIGAATSSRTVDVNLIRAATGIMTKDALIIPVYEIGSGMANQPYVVADFGQRGLPVFYSVEKAWLNK
jgi:ABC-type transport system substrate-binding protein